MILLKNNSDKQHNGGVDLVITLMENPITNTRQWSEKPMKLDGTEDKLQSRGFDSKDESKKFDIVIKAGETVSFGGKEKFNEEQAEYLYLTFGSPIMGSREGLPNYNWLLEVDENGDEIKTNLYYKYRSLIKQEPNTQPIKKT